MFRNTHIINYLLILRLPSLQTNGVKGRNHHHFEVYVTPISRIQVSYRDEKTCSTDLEKNWCSVHAIKRNAFLQFKKSSLVLIIPLVLVLVLSSLWFYFISKIYYNPINMAKHHDFKCFKF